MTELREEVKAELKRIVPLAWVQTMIGFEEEAAKIGDPKELKASVVEKFDDWLNGDMFVTDDPEEALFEDLRLYFESYMADVIEGFGDDNEDDEFSMLCWEEIGVIFKNTIAA